MITRVTNLSLIFAAMVLVFVLIASDALQILRVNRQKPRPGPRPTTRPGQMTNTFSHTHAQQRKVFAARSLETSHKLFVCMSECVYVFVSQYTKKGSCSDAVLGACSCNGGQLLNSFSQFTNNNTILKFFLSAGNQEDYSFNCNLFA